MKLSNILKENLGLFSSDIKIRMKNNQIEINGKKIKEDIDITVSDLEITDAGTFIAEHIVPNEIWRLRCHIMGLNALWDFDNDLSKFFSDFLFLKISKRESFIIKIK